MSRTRGADNVETIAAGLEQTAVLLAGYLPGRQGITFTAGLALAMLDRQGAVRLTALASAIGITQPSTSQLVQRLEDKGLVTRTSDPGDGRAALIAITDAGRSFLAERQRAGLNRLADLLATLSAEDVAALTLAMHVAAPIFQKMLANTTLPRVPRATATTRPPRGQAQEDTEGDSDD
jgi:DNA-binding MarR family transcriptional regulator